jgi:YidC/Oxa1 family membrane protein insertase
MKEITIFILCFLPIHLNLFGNDKVQKNEIFQNYDFSAFTESDSEEIINDVRESMPFFGLASYYNNVSFKWVREQGVENVVVGESITLDEGEWFAIVGRFKVFVFQQPNLVISINEDGFILDGVDANVIGGLTDKEHLTDFSNTLSTLKYNHLWKPFAWLANTVEKTLLLIHRVTQTGWGLTIILFSVFLKIVMLPVALLTLHFQRSVSRNQAKLLPIVAEIRKSYKGEDAHIKTMEAYKELGISPFYALKPMIGTLIQVPILIAVFNALGEMPQFVGSSFLWIKDLAYADAWLTMGITLPLFGSTLNLLPFLMTMVTIISTLIFSNKLAPIEKIRKQKRNLYFMAVAFFVLFYPFPAVMVVFWLLANVLQTIQQQFLKV